MSLEVVDKSGLVALDNLTKLLGDDTFLTEGGAMLLDRMRKRFLKETAPDGSPWQVSYAAKQRATTGRGGGTLFDTGRLFHSIQLARMTSKEVSIATDVPYAEQHQLGLNGLPKREFLGAADEDIELFGQILVNKMLGVFNK